MLSGQLPRIKSCHLLQGVNLDDMPADCKDCCKYTNCSSENISLTVSLKEELYGQSLLAIENEDPDEAVSLTSSIYLELSSDNGWFYWGVGLTCLLLISLVIFTGIVFYWMLKYKRVKKMYEQFKLTEQSIIKQD